MGVGVDVAVWVGKRVGDAVWVAETGTSVGSACVAGMVGVEVALGIIVGDGWAVWAAGDAQPAKQKPTRPNQSIHAPKRQR